MPDGPAAALECNCSICSMTGFLHVMVPHADFELITGRNDLASYRFGSGRRSTCSAPNAGSRASTSRVPIPTPGA
ncbi:GFA family protein [Sphingomonas daechungensis]|uniref:hypothetical protein n=1 Tax=Sphingomonas daechungensis TaxID=1176646 RepID=UPI001CB8C822|nr:hypothetical protein [Sphingomonas daechungensis]